MKHIVLLFSVFLSLNLYPGNINEEYHSLEFRLKKISSGLRYIVVDENENEMDQDFHFIYPFINDMRAYYKNEMKRINIVRKLGGKPHFSYKLRFDGVIYSAFAGIKVYLANQYGEDSTGYRLYSEILTDYANSYQLDSKKLEELKEWQCEVLLYGPKNC